jgi:hypothetical protein
MDMRILAGVMAVLAGVAVGLAQVPSPAPQVASPAPTSTAAAATKPKNIDKALAEDLDFHAANAQLQDAVEMLRQITKTNIAVNWPALELAGIKHDTPVTLHLSKVTYEQALRALLEELPAKTGSANYLVGGNTVEITTTAELGKQAIVRLYPIKGIAAASISGGPTAEQLTAHEDFLKKVVHFQLELAGEDVDGKGRGLAIENDVLAATQSRRAQAFVQHTLALFAAPVRINQQPPGMQVSAQEKKAQERMNELCGKDPAKIPAVLAAIVANPVKAAPDLNVGFLPGAAQTPADQLAYGVTDGGIVMIGPAAEIQGHVTIAVYDMRDILKREAFRSTQKPPATADELADSVVARLKSKVLHVGGNSGEWGELGKSRTWMARYEGFIVVSATPATQRAISAALQDMYR